ncbi:MAG: transcriptional regulator NrdR [Ardenticatenaceae bacterium]|nr:transcriptional regulator NrdR [Ardenticatenaceae bacterium]
MKCPYCAHERTRVIDTAHDTRGAIRRRRVCQKCNQRFSTLERAILATPLIVKRGGIREEFSHEKLSAGIRLACEKRPVAAADIERIVNEVESDLQKLGKAEVSSRYVGDQVMRKLRELDQVAYIRFATVYLRLDDLESVRDEINRLLDMKDKKSA